MKNTSGASTTSTEDITGEHTDLFGEKPLISKGFRLYLTARLRIV